MVVLESERIYLRRFMASDVDAIFAYRSLPEVALFQYWDPYTREDVSDFINRNINSDLNILNEWNGFAIICKKDDTLIGDCAIKISDTSAEIGCNISPTYQSQGFAKESLSLLIDSCFAKKRVDVVEGITDSNNIPSIRLMEALGMERLLDFEEKIICKDIWSVEHKYFLRK